MSVRRIFPLTIPVFLLGIRASAQIADDFNPPRANCCLATTAKGLAEQLQDWNQLGRYHQANEELKRQGGDPRRVVFLGDSITDGWRLNEYFPGKPYVNRGISGQTTPQMLVHASRSWPRTRPGAGAESQDDRGAVSRRYLKN
jgi:acyl-CoA thioesterase I